ncbi:MAG TPA: DUF1800 domain-containing protein [Chitinophagaceae bacterium]|jgi:uncharacterized protein (DUF1800 family)|nr:DUF1800 domain-containing protein [Chitinophagaceae bacterium]
MDRRDFLVAGRKKASTANISRSFRTNSGLNPYSGPWTTNEVVHLLKRTMFGAKKSDIDYFKAKTVSEAVDELLNPSAPMPSPPVNDYSPATPDPTVAAGQTWVNNPTNDGTLNSARRASFKKWWTGVMINQDRSIREKMTMFWANHFGTETNDINISHFVYNHHNLLRQSCLGNFKALIKNVTIDCGMLRYLNGYLNTASAPDENYGRELQELFTIGKDPVTNLAPFTEDDVKKAAKVLTGWRINNSTFVSYFDATRHDTTNKQFSSFYNDTVITGRTGTAGANETDDLLTMIFNKNEVSKFICRKLYRWFIYYNIDATAEANVIEPLATIFRNNNYEIKPVLNSLLKSEHFFDMANQGCQIKSPVDQVVGCLREFSVAFPNPVSEYSDAYGMWNYIRNWFASMAQDVGDPPNVSGWPPYYQAPQFYEIWINSDTLPKRNRFTDTMITNGYTRNSKKIIIDAVNFTKTFLNPGDPNALIDEALSILYRVPLSSQSKQTIKQQILLSNQAQDYYWTNAWDAYIANPSNQGNFNVVNTRLKNFYQYLMNLSEYQLA